jgi:hypothetical protein
VSPASPQTSSLSLNTEELLLHQKDRVATIVLLALLASLHFSTVATTTGDLAQAQSGHEVARLGLHEQPDTFSAPAGSAPPWAHPEPSSSTQEALIDVHLPPSRQGKQHMLLVSMSPLFFFCGVRKISEQVALTQRVPKLFSPSSSCKANGSRFSAPCALPAAASRFTVPPHRLCPAEDKGSERRGAPGARAERGKKAFASRIRPCAQ